MKTEQEIKFRLNTCEGILERTQKEYLKLNQIDMLSAEGSLLMDTMNQMTGQITALNWVKEPLTL